MQRCDFRQKLRRYNILSQKCEVRKTELNLAYKKALKSSNDSISRLPSRNYSATTTMTSARLTTTTISPSKYSIMISHHTPTKTSNSNIYFNSPISGSPINRRSDKREENEIFNEKKENLSDLIDDSQEIFDIIHSKNESSSRQNSADIEKEFQKLVKQVDDEEKEQKRKQEKENQNAEEDEEGSDENEEDENDENEVDFEFKEEETQNHEENENPFEFKEEEETQNHEENENPFEFKEEETQNHEENENPFEVEEEEQEDEKIFDVEEKNLDAEEENHENILNDDDQEEEENHENVLNDDDQEEEENHENILNGDEMEEEEEDNEKVLNE